MFDKEDNDEQSKGTISNDSTSLDVISEEARGISEEEVEELESGDDESLDSQIEELEKQYDHYNRAGDSNASTTDTWSKLADATLEEMIDLKLEKFEQLGKKHDAIDHEDFVGAGQKKRRLYSRFQTLKGEIEELQKVRGEQ